MIVDKRVCDHCRRATKTLETWGVRVSSSTVSVVEWEGELVSSETFATRHYESLGWSVMQLESAPLHALFGVMMCLPAVASAEVGDGVERSSIAVIARTASPAVRASMGTPRRRMRDMV